MRTLGEAKLAISNLYNRITGKTKSSDPETSTEKTEKHSNSFNNTTNSRHQEYSVTNEGSSQPLANAHVDDKSVADKLHSIQDRLIDLQIVATKVEQLLSKERSK